MLMKINIPIFQKKLILSYVCIICITIILSTFVYNRNIYGSIFSAVCLAGSTTAAILIITRHNSEPLRRIIHACRNFTNGDFNNKIFIHSKDAIGELASTLNIMAESLDRKIGDIQIKSQQLVAIIESMTEGIIVVDKNSRIVSMNNTIEKIFSIKKKESTGAMFLEVIRNNDIAEIITRTLNKGTFISIELSLVWPVQRIFQINASPIFEKDTISGCLLVIHDITELRQLETIRRDFVANVSHEIKTPLTCIKGFVETLLEGALDDAENSRYFLHIIKDNTNRLDMLVNDLLALSHLESCQLSLKKETLPLKKIADDVLAVFRTQLNTKNIIVRNNFSPVMQITADKDKMTQVFTNLIDNAIKFNKASGTITLYSQEAAHTLTIYIEDSGSGIPASDIPRIFERFYRVDKARSREVGGTGLGLAIVKHIIELHGGTLNVKSIEGEGSTFSFSLPA